jgi:type I restriction enzyme S subunit
MKGIRARYKQTEVGVIPEDWEILNLESITDPKRSISYGIVQTGPNIQNGIRCLRVVDIEDGKINSGDMITTSKTISDSYKRTILKAEDLVMPLRGKVGDIAFVNDELAGCNLTRGVALIAVRPDWSARYCRQYISSSSTRNRLEQSMNGSALQEIPIASLRSFKIALPPTKAEQEAIAEALSDTDGLIESLEQLIAKKRHLKQGAMQELLTGKKRLPGFSGEWEVKRLGDIGESLIGLTYRPIDVRSDGVLVLRSSNVFEGRLRFEDNVFVETEIPEKIMVRTGDILICVRNGSRDLIGKCAKIDERCQGMTFGAFMAVFRTSFHNFAFHQFQSDIIKRQIREHLGATINQITNKSLNSFQLPFPLDEAEQTAIATILSDMDAEIAALETKLTKTRQLKQGMMHNLLTGKIRLFGKSMPATERTSSQGAHHAGTR